MAYHPSDDGESVTGRRSNKRKPSCERKRLQHSGSFETVLNPLGLTNVELVRWGQNTVSRCCGKMVNLNLSLCTIFASAFRKKRIWTKTGLNQKVKLAGMIARLTIAELARALSLL